jgi:RHS repeat-associated protein
MGYFLTDEPRNLLATKSFVPPKTHTPGSRLEKRGLRFYFPEVGRWVSRDPIEERGGIALCCFVMNTSANCVDTLGDSIFGPTPSAGDALAAIMKFVSALNDAKECIEGMIAAEKAASAWFWPVNEKYICCGTINPKAKISDFPGADTGDAGSTCGVLHCALGVEAKAHGVGDSCLNTFNVLWEMWEVISPKYREWVPEWMPDWLIKHGGGLKKGIEGWLKDTISDMKEVVGGYNDVKSKEDCIPKSCRLIK